MADIRINALATTAASTASDDFIAVDGSANGTRKLNAYSPTFGGNLTTSGTLGVSGNTATIGNGTAGADSLYLKLNGGYTSGTNDIAGVQMQLGGVTAAKISLNELVSDTYGIVFATYGSGSLNNAAAITGAGNLLIGTTTDGGQKLQVSGTVAMSGTSFTQDWGSTGANRGIIKLGQHATLANIAAVSLNGDTSDAGLSGLFGGGQNNTYIQAPASGSVIVRTNGNTTALTLDSSQNATFAGNTTAKGTTHYFGADNSQRIELTSNNGSSQGLIEFYNRGTSAYFAARYLASSHTFEQGPIAINNTVQTAVAVASTHKVTISIGGTTYYLLATNV